MPGVSLYAGRRRAAWWRAGKRAAFVNPLRDRLIEVPFERPRDGKMFNHEESRAEGSSLCPQRARRKPEARAGGGRILAPRSGGCFCSQDPGDSAAAPVRRSRWGSLSLCFSFLLPTRTAKVKNQRRGATRRDAAVGIPTPDSAPRQGGSSFSGEAPSLCVGEAAG